MDSIKNRRTIRKYKAQDIPVDLLNDMLETSFRAATMGICNYIVLLLLVIRE